MYEDSEARMRLARLERRVDHLYAKLGIEEPEGMAISPEVKAALATGNMIQAIKVYREQTGVGLAEAKAAIEGMASGEPHIIQ